MEEKIDRLPDLVQTIADERLEYPYKRSHLVALRPTKISASDPPST
jgi:hypothetical protein